MCTDPLDERRHVRDHADLAAGGLQCVEHGECAVERCGVERAEAFVDEERAHADVVR